MIRIKSLAVIGALALATAACGDRPVDRALTGGAIGAGGGALIGAAAGNPWAGAAVGAVGGAAIAQPPPASVQLLSHRPQAIAAASCM